MTQVPVNVERLKKAVAQFDRGVTALLLEVPEDVHEHFNGLAVELQEAYKAIISELMSLVFVETFEGKTFSNLKAEELDRLMQGLGQRIDVAMRAACEYSTDSRPMFVLMVFDDPENVQYVSSVMRDDCVKALRAMADRLESGIVQ